MIALDTSAVVEMLAARPDAEYWRRALVEIHGLMMSAANIVELALVMQGRDRNFGTHDIDRFASKFDIEIVPVDREEISIAMEASRRYGKGRHPARLNYGDCFAYALAKSRNVPLLFKGGDFTLTDVLVHPASRP